MTPPIRDLIIVSRDRGDVYDLVRRSASVNSPKARLLKASVEIRFDQRVGERRRASLDPRRHERRQAPNRRTRDVTGELARLGWVIVRAAERARRAD
jgi:hypothetical protein